MTVHERAAAYAAAFPTHPPLQIVQEGTTKDRHDVIYGVWMPGQDYRNKTRYYGAYPAGYLDRVMALFPDVCRPRASQSDLLHVFSGSLPPGNYKRCDMVQPAELGCSVYDLPKHLVHCPRLVLADPPYSSADAEKYCTPMVDRRRAMAALAMVTQPGGHLVWLDTVWPMHRKTEWRTVGRIALVRSTNHRVRMVSIFERRAA